MSATILKDFVKNGRKIYGAAFNYKNPGTDPSKFVDQPVLFLKAPTDYITEGHPIIVRFHDVLEERLLIPKGYTIMEEIELGIVIGKTCKHVSKQEAMDYVGGYCLALDLTATNEMNKVRSQGWPWTILKSFDTACPVSKFIPKECIADPCNLELFCDVNGKTVQNGNTKELLFSPSDLISYISQYHTLEPNDVILTGTPPVPQAVKAGDVIRGGIKNGVTIEFTVKI